MVLGPLTSCGFPLPCYAQMEKGLKKPQYRAFLYLCVCMSVCACLYVHVCISTIAVDHCI